MNETDNDLVRGPGTITAAMVICVGMVLGAVVLVWSNW